MTDDEEALVELAVILVNDVGTICLRVRGPLVQLNFELLPCHWRPHVYAVRDAHEAAGRRNRALVRHSAVRTEIERVVQKLVSSLD